MSDFSQRLLFPDVQPPDDAAGDYQFDAPTEVMMFEAFDVEFVSPFWPGLFEQSQSRQCGWSRLTYDHVDAFLLVYSVTDSSCFLDWLPKHYGFAKSCEDAARQNRPCILVGTQTDRDGRAVTRAEGEAYAKKISALAFLEVSANNGGKEFVELTNCIRSALSGEKRKEKAKPAEKEKKCFLM
jgi:hypothetical protein